MTDIRQLIPQHPPILLVDRLESVEGDTAVCSLTVRKDNCFTDEDGLLAETGVVEHIAQSASALAGYRTVQAGTDTPPVGYIGEVKKFHCFRLPRMGETLRTTVDFETEVGGVTMLSAKVYSGNELIATTQMKISVTHSDIPSHHEA